MIRQRSPKHVGVFKIKTFLCLYCVGLICNNYIIMDGVKNVKFYRTPHCLHNVLHGVTVKFYFNQMNLISGFLLTLPFSLLST